MLRKPGRDAGRGRRGGRRGSAFGRRADGARRSSPAAGRSEPDRIVLDDKVLTFAGGPSYVWVDVPPVWGQDGGTVGANIRIVVFFRIDRGLTLAEAPPGDAATWVAVVAGAVGPHLSHNLALIDPANPSFKGSRKPLAVEFAFALFVLSLHLLSLLDDDPPFGRVQPPAATTAEKRLAQAEAVALFVEGLRTIDPTARVIVLGNLNAPDWSPTAARLASAGLVNLVVDLPAARRYTTIAGGNAQATALVLVNPVLAEVIRSDDLPDYLFYNSRYGSAVGDASFVVIRRWRREESRCIARLPRSCRCCSSGRWPRSWPRRRSSAR